MTGPVPSMWQFQSDRPALEQKHPRTARLLLLGRCVEIHLYGCVATLFVTERALRVKTARGPSPRQPFGSRSIAFDSLAVETTGAPEKLLAYGWQTRDG